MLITLYKIGEVHFCFHVKAKNERFTAAAHVIRATNVRISRRRLADLKNCTKSVPRLQHYYFSSWNQSNHWVVAVRRHLFREFKK